ncbi:MAG: tRNA (cytidine(34)-2'-O)-methyltransferase [Rhodocyclaceae bacterium]|nr:tRNA (cytidine(34)-2'-O)-methyltransferase [Rhodocyclaceae bacterium]
MFHIVLFSPEIPPNTGNIIRLCANTGASLHLIKPLGFVLSDKTLARAGLDYHHMACVTVHEDWAAFRAEVPEGMVYALTTRGTRHYAACRFAPGDVLLFGSETRGLPEWLRGQIGEDCALRIPMRDPSRSINLSNAVAVVLYEAWRQHDFADGV